MKLLINILYTGYSLRAHLKYKETADEELAA